MDRVIYPHTNPWALKPSVKHYTNFNRIMQIVLIHWFDFSPCLWWICLNHQPGCHASLTANKIRFVAYKWMSIKHIGTKAVRASRGWQKHCFSVKNCTTVGHTPKQQRVIHYTQQKVLHRQVSWEQVLLYNDGLPRQNPDHAGTIVRRPMGLPITAGCNTAWNRTRDCSDTSCTVM